MADLGLEEAELLLALAPRHLLGVFGRVQRESGRYGAQAPRCHVAQPERLHKLGSRDVLGARDEHPRDHRRLRQMRGGGVAENTGGYHEWYELTVVWWEVRITSPRPPQPNIAGLPR